MFLISLPHTAFNLLFFLLFLLFVCSHNSWIYRTSSCCNSHHLQNSLKHTQSTMVKWRANSKFRFSYDFVWKSEEKIIVWLCMWQKWRPCKALRQRDNVSGAKPTEFHTKKRKEMPRIITLLCSRLGRVPTHAIIYCYMRSQWYRLPGEDVDTHGAHRASLCDCADARDCECARELLHFKIPWSMQTKF